MENTVDDTIFDSTKRKKSKKKIPRDVLSEVVATSVPTDNVAENTYIDDADFTYEYLIERVYTQIYGDSGGQPAAPSTIYLPPVEAGRVGTRRTSFTNFGSMCKALQRHEKVLYDYFISELGTTASIDSNHALIIRGRLKPTQIENVLRSFIREYVLCKTCRSPHTILKKVDRLLVVICTTCRSEITVPNIRQLTTKN